MGWLWTGRGKDTHATVFSSNKTMFDQVTTEFSLLKYHMWNMQNNAASKLFLVYTYVPSPGKESTFQPQQQHTLYCPFRSYHKLKKMI